MARRYGGPHSPDGADTGGDTPPRSAFATARRSRAGGRVNLLFIVPLPLVWQAFTSGPAGLVLNLAALGLLLLAAWLTREGLLAQDAYEARRVARRPAFPRKMAGSVLTGTGLAIAGYAVGGGIVAPAIYGVVGAVLHGLAFGLDPMTDKGADSTDAFQTRRVARAVDEAEKHLTAMSEAIARTRDRTLQARVERFQATARDLFRTVEQDPRDLTAARKYLSVYLLGARDATVKFADIHARTGDAKARADYEALLDDLERNFTARTRKMLLDDRSDLTIEIDVLRDRLRREGVAPQSD
ncbi:5-bromo-4-chloroindolyl phosphate hydrolysis protein [Salinihabitans flavidus]|uniref:5-bromo-4-chloroindolyl phosphate hydrolysis protein n=1 Tax=Salinihabitans flavidus TaxID=569882 RepID=A0A1H8U1H9_9RHOB|nr:5-bromo-4-chloroindolyl phosphate hydrolysis family protein [Salinihabitans flavidus]SEO96508.1 5-bromo-4-chloroindolyl phosphate hydrolysis protein [Salinihabitans flavidus]